MPIVTFVDSKGAAWRVWEVSRSDRAGRADYVPEEYRTGWLCFESLESGERRRLSSYPANWATLPPVHLRVLLARAAAAGRRAGGEPHPSDLELPPPTDPDPPPEPGR